MRNIIGIDAGVEEIKAILYDEKGSVLAKKTAQTGVSSGDLCETNMVQYWLAAYNSIQALMKVEKVKPEDIAGIALTGVSDGLFCIDKTGKPVMPAILNQDKRAFKEEFAVTQGTPGVGNLIHSQLGHSVTSGSTLMLLKWLKENETVRYNQIDKIFFAKDWICFCLTGRIITDTSDATSCYSQMIDGKVPKQMLTVLGLSKVENTIPEILPMGSVAGVVSTEIAAELGLPKDLPVIIGASRAVSSTLGVGAISPTDIALDFGQQLRTMVVQRRKDFDFKRLGKGKGYFDHIISGYCVEESVANNAENNLFWAQQALGKDLSLEEIDNIIAKEEPGSGGVLYHPYLSIEGERAPFYHPIARGSFFGLNEKTTDRQMLRAVYEGISYSIRECIDIVGRVGVIYLSGTGSDLEYFPQIIADITGRNVGVFDSKEFSTKGAVIMAGVALGVHENYEEAVTKCCRVSKYYKPQRIQIYTDAYNLFRDFRTTYAGLWKKQQRLFQK